MSGIVGLDSKSERPRIVITGASGFVGGSLFKDALEQGFVVFAPNRRELSSQKIFKPGDVVIHCAAIAHTRYRCEKKAKSELKRVNVELTEAIALNAVAAGAKRFLFLSSVKAIGEETELNYPFTTQTVCEPQDFYGVSKLEAENRLWSIHERGLIEVCVVRSPLVYGAGVKANFRKLCSLVMSGVPIPVLGVHNKRSLINVKNLSDVLLLAVSHPAAAGELFLVADNEDLSITDLVTRIAFLSGRKPRFFWMPLGCIEKCLGLLGKDGPVRRLRRSLQVDSSKIQEKLNWRPTVTVEEGLRQAIDAIRKE